MAGLQGQAFGVAHQRQCPGVEQQARRVEAVAGFGAPRTAGAQAVELAGSEAGHEGGPEAVAFGLHCQALVFHRGTGFEKAYVHAVGIGCPHREVHAVDAFTLAELRTECGSSARRHPSTSGCSQSTPSGGSVKSADQRCP